MTRGTSWLRSSHSYPRHRTSVTAYVRRRPRNKLLSQRLARRPPGGRASFVTDNADEGWRRFDSIVGNAPINSPWTLPRTYQPNFSVLEDLLGVPIQLGLTTQSRMPAKAIDVWVAYELRRAGFPYDEVWPRQTVPRVLPREVALLRTVPGVTIPVRKALFDRLDRNLVKGGVAPADAKILGKTYEKQVDVVMSSWARGPEIMISTKRMDSSFGKNALNRIEESYGDAKNLRGRHPLAATGFLFVIRSTAFEQEYDTVMKLMDLLAKLAYEPDAYDATAAIVTEWKDPEGHRVKGDLKDGEAFQAQVSIRHDLIPDELDPSAFLASMIDRVLSRVPVDIHKDARRLRGDEWSTIEDDSGS